MFAALLFVSAGTLLWPAGWAFIAIFFSFAVAIVLWLARKEPELPAERMSSPMQRGQPLWDKVFVVAVMVLFVAWLILMPLDAVRFGWSEVPDWLEILGALGVVLSFYIMFLIFRENAYLAVVVKVQEERGQSVVSTGPYRYVRHPMDASTFLFFPGSALLLGSWWGLLLCVVLLGLLVWRILLEERILEKVVEAFLAAARGGDFDALVAVLDSDIVERVDTGSGTIVEVRGAQNVARRTMATSQLGLVGRSTLINGAPDWVSLLDGELYAIGALTVQNGRIRTIGILLDPARLDLTVFDPRL